MADRPYDDVREAFIESDTRFKESMASAFAAHSKCVALFLATLTQVGQREADLQESIDSLKAQMLDLGAELRELKQRLNGDH